MLKKVGKTTLLIIFCLLSASIQFSLVSALPGAFGDINIGLMMLVFILFFLGIKSSILFIIFFGFFLDVFSFQFFGFYISTLAVTVLVAYIISKNWLTNKSLYSVWVIFLISTLVYNLFSSILFLLFSGSGGDFSVFGFLFWRSLFYQLAWNILVSILFFPSLISLTKRFKPFFLEKKGVI
jgi:hypothetical protein